MSSCSSDFEDCSDELVKVAHTKKKWKRNRVNSGKKEYYKSNDKAKISLKNTNRIIRTKKLSTKVREFERSNKSSQIEQIESRNNNINNNNNNQNIDSNEQLLNNDLPTININADLLNLNLNDNFNENASVASNLTSEINKISKDGATDSDDSDKNERVKYIKLLSKLIDLNMPSKIESNRSNEAYTRRQCFLEKRRYNSDKIESCYPLFCREAFWLELQHRVKSRKDDRIKKMKDKTVSILKELMQFKVEDVDVEDCELPKEKIYAISKPYLTKIKNAHKQLSDLMGRYYYYLSFWSTTATMRNSIIDENPNYIEYYQTITENIDTMQAWQNCCQWLNWKTRQICQLVGIYGNALNNFVIIGHHQNNSSNITVDNTEFNFEEKFSNSTECGDTNCESRNHSADKYRLRSHSLNMAMDYINSTNIVTSDSSLENLSDSDYESKFETYADINRRRYGMEKVCSSAINSVSEMLDKYKNLFSITKDENTLPLMHSYAEAVKDGINCPTCINTQNGKQLIYTENLSEASNSSYQTAKPVFDDNQEFPTIQSLRPCNISLFSSPSLSSNPSMSHIVQEDIPDASDETIMDLLRKKFEMESINYPREPDTFRESKGLFGLRNQVAARLSLPPLLPHYLFLVKFPIKLMHCCIRKILGSPDISKISELSVITIKQRIIDFKDALQFTMRARQFLFDYTFGINFQINKFLASNSKDFAPKQDVDLSDFLSSSMKEIDGDLSSLLRHYIDCLKELLKKWSKSSTSCKFEYGEPRKLLEEEWTFVKTYCHNIKQEEEIVASSFCNLAEYLFDLLQSRIESDYKLNIDVDNSPNDSPSLSNAEEDILSVSSINNRRMSKCCQTYNNKCKMIQSQLKQAADFSKMLRSDLEISIQLELNLNYSMNDLLSFLSLTKHKMIDLCSSDEQSSINPIDLTLIIPEESSSFIKELLDPLITGFSIHPKDDTVRTTLLNSSSSKPRCIKSREYILIINKKSKINWPGEKIKFIYQLDIGNLKQRIESSNIVFLARRPDELTEQLSHLLEFKIPSKHHNIQFKNVIQSCSEGQVEACHYNSKRTLNALKSKAIEIGQVLHNFFMYDKNDSFSVSELNKIQEETVRNSIKNSYSIIFEFYRDLIKLCTGDAFKTVLKNTIVGLLEKWFEFSRKFEPSEKGTVPRWANDGLNFLLQLCQSRVVMTMTKKEWHDFKKSIDNFVEFIVGKSNRHHSTTSGKSTTNSSKVVTGRSWLVTPKPDVIRGCENNASNSKKIENWDIKCDNRTLRSAFSEPSRMISSDQNSFPNQLDRHIDMKTPGNFNEISFTRSITVAEQGLEHSRDAPNSNKSTDGSSNEDHKDRKRVTLKQAIVELENQLNEKRRQNNLMGFVRDSNSDNTSSCYIKKAPFQWIKKGLIGQGHAGTVFKVCNLDTMEIMAMKEIVINEPFSQDLIECDLLCKLNHASLLKYHGVDISLSHMRIFTEYCEGGSLSQVSILDIPEINLRQWTKQILEAIMHLHSHKIVHRDVKPDNIFLKNIEGTNECHAKLGDFGVAKCLVNHLDGLKDIKGTVMYMAPEVAVVDSEQNKSKHGYNHKVDIWSLGCMVLYMITGKPPWDEYQHLAIYYNLGMKKLPFIPAVDSTARMTKEARDFIVGCLKINPDERLEALDLLNFNFVKLRNH